MEIVIDTLLEPRILILALGSGAYLAWSKIEQRKRNPLGLPLPPGPKGLPIFGNTREVTEGNAWETYDALSKEFGNLIYLEILGKPLLVLNSQKEINDLLEKKAPIFSDRVHTPSLSMLNLEWNFGLADYGPVWKDNRRVFHQHFGPGQLAKYHPVLEQQTIVFLRRLAADPSDFRKLVKYFFGAVIMQISYGVSDPAYTSKLIDNAGIILDGFGEVALPGRFLVDALPILRYVPSWFPGAQWKRTLQRYGRKCLEVYHGTFADALERSRKGVQGQHANVADEMITKLPDPTDPTYPAEEEMARNTTLLAYIAGVDTTTHSAHALFLALAKYPKVQKRAQKEIERVLGPCRLPKPSDMPKIPYLAALIKELSRWHTVAPIGLPRQVRKDTDYNGYFIPKGTVVFGNSWAIMHDPAKFKDPFDFNPERYLTSDGQIDTTVLDPEAAAFGFGRRICPGRYLSNDTLTFMAASFLSVFDIAPAKAPDGKPVELKLEFGNEFVPKLAPFDIEITLRSPAHAALLSEF